MTALMEVKSYCANCKFFDSRGTKNRNFGRCVKYAPHPLREDKDKSGFAKWLMVHVDDRCGEFEVNLNLKDYVDFSKDVEDED